LAPSFEVEAKNDQASSLARSETLWSATTNGAQSIGCLGQKLSKSIDCQLYPIIFIAFKCVKHIRNVFVSKTITVYRTPRICQTAYLLSQKFKIIIVFESHTCHLTCRFNSLFFTNAF